MRSGVPWDRISLLFHTVKLRDFLLRSTIRKTTLSMLNCMPVMAKRTVRAVGSVDTPGKSLARVTNVNTRGFLFSSNWYLIGERATAIPIVCVTCDQLSRYVRNRRLQTMYVDEQSNWICSCDTCYFELWQYYDELIEEACAGLL